MKRGRHAVARFGTLATVAAALSLVAAPASAQGSAAPPTSPAASSAPAPQKPAASRPAIQLSPAERQAIDSAQSARDKPAKPQDDLAPTADDMKPRVVEEEGETRIEQKRVSNRISEVIVTPANSTRSYSMTNREGQQMFGTTPLGNTGNLSVPTFFRFEFGRSTTPPATNPPPPPAQSPTR
jgi:hypothetical protein